MFRSETWNMKDAPFFHGKYEFSLPSHEITSELFKNHITREIRAIQGSVIYSCEHGRWRVKMYIHRRPSKFALPCSASFILLSFLFPPLSPSSSVPRYFSSRDRFLQAEFSSASFYPASSSFIRSRENFCTIASCILSSLQRAFLRHLSSSSRV